MTQVLTDQELLTSLVVLLRSAAAICRHGAEVVLPFDDSRALAEVLVQARMLPEYGAPIYDAICLLDVAWHAQNSVDFSGMEVLCTALANLLEETDGC